MAEQDPENPAPTKAKKGGGKTLPIVLIVLLLLAGAGGGAWWWASRANAATASSGEAASQDDEGAAVKKKKKKKVGIAVPMQPFLVNLADEGSSRFLRCTLSLVVDDEEAAVEITGAEGHGKGVETILMTRLRSAILELLTTQSADILVTPEGKQKLKAAIIEKANAVLPDEEVSDVLFSDFVVQF